MAERSTTSDVSRHPLTIVAVVALLILGFYYLFSPYQKCVSLFKEQMGEYPLDEEVTNSVKRHCNELTSW